ncbi:transcription initiation factor TFIID subunit 2 [Sesbania bispinosa]|nr:transcription initiation factor TFIID subunit 2 [Sesbania bispinosa]
MAWRTPRDWVARCGCGDEVARKRSNMEELLRVLHGFRFISDGAMTTMRHNGQWDEDDVVAWWPCSGEMSPREHRAATSDLKGGGRQTWLDTAGCGMAAVMG